MKFEMKHKPMSVFNFISLADIVLLLLIYFLLTSTYVVQKGIRVRLPKSVTSEKTTVSKQITVTVTKSGAIFLNGKPVSMNNLSAKVKQLLEKNPKQIIVLRADASIPLEKAVKVLDEAKKAGGEKLLIATFKEE